MISPFSRYDVDTALYITVAWLPALCGLIALFLLWGYKLTEEQLAATPVEG